MSKPYEFLVKGKCFPPPTKMIYGLFVLFYASETELNALSAIAFEHFYRTKRSVVYPLQLSHGFITHINRAIIAK